MVGYASQRVRLPRIRVHTHQTETRTYKTCTGAATGGERDTSTGGGGGQGSISSWYRVFFLLFVAVDCHYFDLFLFVRGTGGRGCCSLIHARCGDVVSKQRRTCTQSGAVEKKRHAQ